MELVKGKTYINIDKESEYYNHSFILERIIKTFDDVTILEIIEIKTGLKYFFTMDLFVNDFVDLDIIREKRIKNILGEKSE